MINTISPILPVRTQIYTYSESGGIMRIYLFWLLVDRSVYSTPMPTPHGRSFIYFLSVFLFISLTPSDASSLLKAERMRRMVALPLAILVNAKNIYMNRSNNPTGTAILADLDRKMYMPMPAIKQKMAVRVPVANIAQQHSKQVTI